MPRQQTFHVEGAASLLGSDAQPGVSLATLRALLEMMEGKRRMVHLLNQCISTAPDSPWSSARNIQLRTSAHSV